MATELTHGQQFIIDAGNKAFKGLVETIPKRTLPESIFRHNFYAFFKGEVTNKEQAQQVYQNWVQVAGSTLDAVNIIDDNGAVVYTVPPLGAPASLKVVDKRKNGTHVNATADAIASADTMQGISAGLSISNALARTVQIDQHEFRQAKKAWDETLDFFDTRWGIKTTTKTNAKSSEAKGHIPDDWFN